MALTGVGWPSHAQREHPLHSTYARKVLCAYMPCLGLRGIDYIEESVSLQYNNDWSAALSDFVRDKTNVWCPKWVRRNYESRNKHCLPAQPPVSGDTRRESAGIFEETGEGHDQSDPEPDTSACSRPSERPDWKLPRAPWQEHSALGPNLAAEPLSGPLEPMPDVVNSPTHPWHQHARFLNLKATQQHWERLRHARPEVQLA